MKKLLLIIAIAVVFFACEQEDYLVDGGVSDPNVGTATMSFLQNHPQLDTMAILLERAGLADQVDGETTLFAVNNLSISNYINRVLADLRQEDPLAEYTINDIPTDTLAKYMGGYLFTRKITREDMVKEGEIFTAVNGEKRRISLEPSSSSYSNHLSEPPEYVYYTYKAGDEWDAWDGLTDDTKVIVRTSNLLSTNGVIHVLQGSHTLFNYDPED